MCEISSSFLSWAGGAEPCSQQKFLGATARFEPSALTHCKAALHFLRDKADSTAHVLFSWETLI